jgi:hypothetical protein
MTTGEKLMNSINREKTLRVDTFFFEELVPLAKKLHSKNDSIFFQKKPDPITDTYFVRRKKVTMTPENFEFGGCNSPEDLKKSLISLWIAEGYSELPIIADAIVKLAISVHRIEEQSSEVSPFIYVMF